MKKLILLVAVLVMILGSGSSAIAQTTQEDTSLPQDPSQTASSNDTPIPIFYDSVGDKYYYFDPNTNFYYVLDSATGDVSPYYPV